MKERKYKEDYGLKMVIDDRGREKRETVYRGEWFHLNAQERKKTLLHTGVCAVVFAVFYLVYLERNSPSTRCMYVFPIAACALPCFVYWIMGLWGIWRTPEKMTRVQKEKGIGRTLRSAIGCAVFMGMAAIGDIVFMCIHMEQHAKAEWISFGLIVCAALAAVRGFLEARDAHNQIKSLGKETQSK